MQRVFLVLVMMALPMIAGAQGDLDAPLLTLDEALGRAFGHNRDVKNAGLDVAKAANGVAVIKAMRLPQIDVGVYESYNFTNEDFTFSEGSLGSVTVAGNTFELPPIETKIASANDFTTLVTASMVLPLSQQYRLALGVDKHEVVEGQATQQLRSTRQRIAKDVKDLYYSILRSEASLAATEASIAYRRALAGLVSRNVEQQRALDSDLLSVRTELARAEQRALFERDSLASQREEMNILLGREIETRFRVSPMPDPALLEINQLGAEVEALAQRPIVKNAKLREKQAELEVKIKKAEYIPEVSVEVRYTSPFGSEFVPQNIGTVGLFASWDIWDWGKRSHEVAAKNVELRKARNEIREAQDQVRLDVNRKIRSLRQAEAGVPVALLAEEAAREKLRIVENKYRQESALVEDVLEAEADLAKARRDVEGAKLGVWTSQSDLEKAMGEE
jgi:outer membrane protein TolC